MCVPYLKRWIRAKALNNITSAAATARIVDRWNWWATAVMARNDNNPSGQSLFIQSLRLTERTITVFNCWKVTGSWRWRITWVWSYVYIIFLGHLSMADGNHARAQSVRDQLPWKTGALTCYERVLCSHNIHADQRNNIYKEDRCKRRSFYAKQRATNTDLAVAGVCVPFPLLVSSTIYAAARAACYLCLALLEWPVSFFPFFQQLWRLIYF